MYPLRTLYNISQIARLGLEAGKLEDMEASLTTILRMTERYQDFWTTEEGLA